LRMAPGEGLWIQSNTSGHSGSVHRYTPTFATAANSLLAWVVPTSDTITQCSGSEQFTPWTPRRNTSGANMFLAGATIYAARDDGNLTVTAACIYVLYSDGITVKWYDCNSALTTRGKYSIPISTQTVANNEYVAAQARYTCASSPVHYWDWNAYLWVY
jgi:hypothetical protein